MSGGQRQAIAIARTTHSNAKIILLDEPLAAMGAREGALIIELIRELKQRGDVSMIVIAHNYVHVFEMCDRVNLLRNGRITFDKPTNETSVEELTSIVASEYRLAKPGVVRAAATDRTNAPSSFVNSGYGPKRSFIFSVSGQRPVVPAAISSFTACSSSYVKSSERSRKLAGGLCVHDRVVGREEQVGLERPRCAGSRLR